MHGIEEDGSRASWQEYLSGITELTLDIYITFNCLVFRIIYLIYLFPFREGLVFIRGIALPYLLIPSYPYSCESFTIEPSNFSFLT